MSIITFVCDLCKKYYRAQAKRSLGKMASDKRRNVHFSVDDTIKIFKNLTENKERYKSMFEEPILSYLKELHDEYGLKVCLYCFYEDRNGFNLSQVTDRFSEEFLQNTNWLKVGFHGRNCDLLYDTATAETATTDYTTAIRELQRICGGTTPITRVVRLSGFQGNRESILSMRDCACGVQGLLTADDGRKSYYEEVDFSSEERGMLDGIRYYHTDIRVENCRWRSIEVPDEKENYGVFTHEYYILSKKIQMRMEKMFYKCVKQGRCFTFFE